MKKIILLTCCAFVININSNEYVIKLNDYKNSIKVIPSEVSLPSNKCKDEDIRITLTELRAMISTNAIEIESACTEGIVNMSNLFYQKSSFNRDISKWDVSNVTNMSSMFNRASSFNQDISGWDTSSVITMSGMFYLAEDFNQDIGGWDVSNVTNMSSMLSWATSFDQNISEWNVNNVTNRNYFSGSCPIDGTEKMPKF